MKIRFFLLGIGNHSSGARFQTELKEVFAPNLSDNGDVASYDSMKDATADIAKAVAEAHTLVFVSECEQFGAVKQMLSKAFGFELSCDATLLSRACEQCGKNTDEEDFDFSVTHAFIPANSRVFVLDDGMYAGFSVANGNQTIILLPYEKERTSVLLSSQVIPYLNSVYHENIDNGRLKSFYSEKLIRLLEEKNVQLAVANTSTANFFKEYVSAGENNDLIRFSPISEKRGDMPPVDYVVNLSVVASEFLSCPYGVAISSAYYTGDSPESEKIVYLAVTNERETAVREIHSFKGEDIPSFLTRCCSDLCVFIGDVAEGDSLIENDYSLREKAAAKRYKIAIASVAALILAFAVFIFAYFYSHDYPLSQWAENFIEWVFPAGNPFEGMFDRNTPGDDEALINDESSVDQESTFDAQTQEASDEETTDEVSSDEETSEIQTSDTNEETTVQ